jgi:exopolyphosphatase/guanosine-5'-triphosphate,3'-diphosphate pyrophosphatase
MRTAVVDIGTNSTRLLVAEVDQASGAVEELHRESQVTRLGEDVDAGGELSEEAIGRVFATLARYRATMDSFGCEANLAVLTSAVRDASNGVDFTERVHSEFGLDTRVLSGDEEAQLTFLGAMSNRDGSSSEPTVVIDIGGGSTEFIVGASHTALFHVSVQAGVLRMSERHIHTDPPAPGELQELAADTRAIFLGVPPEQRASVKRGIAVAGTATSAAAIDQELDPYDPERVQGATLTAEEVDRQIERYRGTDADGRRGIAGLQPKRAEVILAGACVVRTVMDLLGVPELTASDRGIRHGVFLDRFGG